MLHCQYIPPYIEDIDRGRYLNEAKLPKHSYSLLKELIIKGEIKRGEVQKVTGLKESASTKLIRELLKRGFIQSDTPKCEIRIKFSAKFAMRLFPDLIPEYKE